MADTESEFEQESILEQREKNGGMLDVSGLTKIYPDGTLAVDDIDFSVREGDFCVIIGPSGCGKSTTLHSLVGTVEATEGTITLDGEEITNTETYERDIGLVFQDFQLFPHLSVEENVRYGLERMGVSGPETEERVEEVIDMMKLDELRNRDPMELSAGQKQRVALARSLVLEPKLILLDEPLGDMDYKLQKRMERELLRIHRDLDTTFVYVTHDQTQAMRLADQIIVMNDGKIEQSASVNNVYNSPSTAFVATFVGDSNIFHGTVDNLHEEGQYATVDTAFGTFEANTDNLTSEPVDLVGNDIIFSVRPQHLTFDDHADNTLSCELDDVLTQAGKGTQVLLEAIAEDGSNKEIQLKSEELLDRPDDLVTVGWSADYTTLLEKTSVVDDVDLQKDILGE